MDAAEVLQAYVEYPNLERMPLKELKYFKRIEIKKGSSENIKIKIHIAELKKWDLKLNAWKLYPGKYKIVLGSNSRDSKAFVPFEIN